MKLEQIKQYADELVELFKPFCKRIEIAGSILRQVDECKDIELVIIPDKYHLEAWLRNAKFTYGFYFTKNGEKMKQFKWKNQQVDLFIATPDNWGWIFFLRTGPKDWNIRAVNKLKKHGVTSSDGILYKDGSKLPTPEEQDIFDLLECNYIQPNRRK